MSSQVPKSPVDVVLRPISALKPQARNPRTHSDEQIGKIAASLAEFGFVNPVLVDENGVILAGHGRLLAAQRLGLEVVPVVEIRHLSEAQKQAYLIADNRLALDAGWDAPLLTEHLLELREEDFDLRLTGFSQKELDDLLAGMDPAPGPGERPAGDEISYSVVVTCRDEADQQELIQLLSANRYQFMVRNE